MSFLRSLFGARDVAGFRSGSIENPNIPLSQLSLDDLTGGYSSDAGESVTPGKALTYAPIFQAVGMISGDCAKLPLGVFKRLDGGARTLDRSHPAFPRISLTGSPNHELDAFKFWRRWFVSALLWGNSWAWIDRAPNGSPLGIYHLLPDRTHMTKRGGELLVVTEVGRRLWELKYSDVLHIEGISIDGMEGENVVTTFRQDFGLALAARKFTSKFFGQGANVGGILQAPPGAKPENMRKVQKGIAEKFTGGAAAFKTLVLRDGFKWFSTQVDPNKANVDRVDERQTIHVAQIYNMDPSRLGVRGSVSYNSREVAKQDYYDSTLSAHLVGTKSELNLKLLSEKERDTDSHFIDYNINALLWADAKSRAEIARSGILAGRFTINETRAWENLNPVKGGDDLLLPMNMVRIDSITGEAKAAPQAKRKEGDSADLRALLETTLRRVHGRVVNHVAKLRGDRSPDRVADAIRSQRSACVDLLDIPVRVVSSQGWSVDAQAVWDRYCEAALEVRGDLDGETGSAIAGQLAESYFQRQK